MIRLHTQNTTKDDKQYIKQAAKFKTSDDAINAGWSFLGAGGYKKTYRKGNIVVKFPNLYEGPKHLVGEAQAYFEFKKHDRKYFARIFGYDENKSIQRFVPSKSFDKLKENKKHTKKYSNKKNRQWKQRKDKLDE